MLVRIILVLALLASPLAAEHVVRLAGVTGKVEVQQGGGAWVPGTPGMELVRGDKIHTGFKAKASLTFPDGSVMEVQPLTMLAVDRLDGPAGEVRSRMLLRSGEVKAQVNRPVAAAGEFQVRTPTATASVRGTRIQRIAYSESTGTRILMGQEGLLEVIGRRGRVFLAAREATGLGTSESSPPTPGEVRRAQGSADISPQGSLREERADIADAGVPQTRPFTQGGSSLASTAVSAGMQADFRETRIEPVRSEPPPMEPAPIDTAPTQPPPTMEPPRMDPPPDMGTPPPPPPPDGGATNPDPNPSGTPPPPPPPGR